MCKVDQALCGRLPAERHAGGPGSEKEPGQREGRKGKCCGGKTGTLSPPGRHGQVGPPPLVYGAVIDGSLQTSTSPSPGHRARGETAWERQRASSPLSEQVARGRVQGESGRPIGRLLTDRLSLPGWSPRRRGRRSKGSVIAFRRLERPPRVPPPSSRRRHLVRSGLSSRLPCAPPLRRIV
ncbi:hypothetical protein EYF80_048117 [Liparis tanakae]|uniref:Uncharacterized protein n=1 Tax=Liparis tanakae TaxID=230148 RepID=A0A4Z2FLS4_9TELE|nr:hypothetical protein EYF80_048117 [Liparis tanakae]